MRWQAYFSVLAINSDILIVVESALATLFGSGKILVYEGMTIRYDGAASGVKISGTVKAQPVISSYHPYGILPKWTTAYASDGHDWSEAVRGRWEIIEGKATGVMFFFNLDAHDAGNTDGCSISVHGKAYPPTWGVSVSPDVQPVVVEGYKWPLKRRY